MRRQSRDSIGTFERFYGYLTRRDIVSYRIYRREYTHVGGRNGIVRGRVLKTVSRFYSTNIPLSRDDARIMRPRNDRFLRVIML